MYSGTSPALRSGSIDIFHALTEFYSEIGMTRLPLVASTSGSVLKHDFAVDSARCYGLRGVDQDRMRSHYCHDPLTPDRMPDFSICVGDWMYVHTYSSDAPPPCRFLPHSPVSHPSHTATVSYNTRGRLAPHNISTYPLPFSVTASPVSRVFILVKNIQGSLGPPCISWIRSRRTLSFRGFLSFLVVSTTQQYLRTYLPSLCIPTYASHADFWPSLLNGRPHLY